MVATDALTDIEQQVGTESQDASSCKTEFATECLIYNIVRGQRAVTTNLARLKKWYSESLVVEKMVRPLAWAAVDETFGDQLVELVALSVARACFFFCISVWCPQKHQDNILKCSEVEI